MLVSLLKRGEFVDLLTRTQHWFSSDSFSVGFYQDLTQPFELPAVAIPVKVRPIAEGEIAPLLNIEEPGISSHERYIRLNRLRFYQANVPTCYVAVTADDTPCCLQWLITSESNERVRDYFGGLFPPLAPDEALLEYAFTPLQYRGQRLNPYLKSWLAKKAADMGLRRIVVFVNETNDAGLKGCKYAGFTPYARRHERWRLFHRSITFASLSADPDRTLTRSQVVSSALNRPGAIYDEGH